MCGRYTAKKNAVELADEFDAEIFVAEDLEADYNVAPTKRVHIVRSTKPEEGGSAAEARTSGARELTVMRWGLIPSWAKDEKIGSKMFNARAESLSTKPAFRSALKRRRCLVPADGWYEWKKADGKTKQPFYMSSADSSELAFAGLWEIWGDKPNRLTTFTIITTDSVGPLQDIHDRMPLVLPPHLWDEWLDRSTEDVADLLAPPTLEVVDGIELRPVGTEVGNVANNGPSLIDRVEPLATRLF